jgi:hypothetical protein
MAIQATAVQVKRKELAEDERLLGVPKLLGLHCSPLPTQPEPVRRCWPVSRTVSAWAAGSFPSAQTASCPNRCATCSQCRWWYSLSMTA